MHRLTLLLVDTFIKLLALTLPPAATQTAVTAVRTGGARPEPVQPGTRVVVLADPLEWGVGRVLAVEKYGRLRCEFEWGEDSTVTELFGAFELEDFDVWMRQANSLSDRDSSRLIMPDRSTEQ